VCKPNEKVNSPLPISEQADYITAATSEVEAAGHCYTCLFPIVERVSNFVLNLVMVCVLCPLAAPFILALVPVAFWIQKSRAPKARDLLHCRHEKERQYVSALADIVENTQAFRGHPMSWIRQTFCQYAASYAQAHFAVKNYTGDTAGHFEILQFFCFGGLLLLGTVTNFNGWFSKGLVLGVINSFRTGSADLMRLGQIAIDLKFCSEGLRTVARILNYPTDAHTLADESDSKVLLTEYHIQSHLRACGSSKKLGEDLQDEGPLVDVIALPSKAQLQAFGTSRWNLVKFLANEGAEWSDVQHGVTPQVRRRRHRGNINCALYTGESAGLEWVNTINLKGTPHKCSARRALRGSRRKNYFEPETTPLGE
jgi:hypothetical protein